MMPSTSLLLGLAGGCMALATAAAVFAVQLQKQQRRVAARFDQVTGHHNQAAAPEPAHVSSRRRTAQSTPALHQVAMLFGYDPARAADYKLRWWIVLPASFAIARLAAELMIPLVGWSAMAALPFVALFMSRKFYKWCTDRRQRALYLQFPDALAMIVRGVRVGIPVAESIRSVAVESVPPTAAEFQQVSDRVAVGLPLDEALREMAERNGLSEYRFFATALGLQSQTGGGLSETLDNLAEVIRKRVAMRARGYALASEARASIMILCALPVITGGALAFINPDYMGQLFTTDLGREVFAAALISFCVGLGVMQFIVKKTLS